MSKRERDEAIMPLFDLPVELVMHMYSFLGVGLSRDGTDAGQELRKCDPYMEFDERYQQMAFTQWFGEWDIHDKQPISSLMENMFWYLRRENVMESCNNPIEWAFGSARNGSSKLMFLAMDLAEKQMSVTLRITAFKDLCRRGHWKAASKLLEMIPISKKQLGDNWELHFHKKYKMVKDGRSVDAGRLGWIVAKHWRWELLSCIAKHGSLQFIAMLRSLTYHNHPKPRAKFEEAIDSILKMLDVEKFARVLGQVLAESVAYSQRVFMILAQRGVEIRCKPAFATMFCHKIRDPKCIIWIDEHLPRVEGLRFTHPLELMAERFHERVYTFETLSQLIRHRWCGNYVFNHDPREYIIYQAGDFYLKHMFDGRVLSTFAERFFGEFGRELLSSNAYKEDNFQGKKKATLFIRSLS